MPMIYLYAEVLANIRQANFYASLETHKNEHTTITIASDKKTITVSHDGETASVYLPTEIGGSAEVNIPIDRGKEISVRLELADIMTLPSVQDVISSEGPWSAKDLSPTSQIQCRACHTQLLTNEVPMGFKDLPSDHWAEMMDLWHCHKPHDAEQNHSKDVEKAAKAKGYSSSNRLKATRGVVFVDAASFLIAEQSCRDIEVGSVVLRVKALQRLVSMKYHVPKFAYHIVACRSGQEEGDLFHTGNGIMFRPPIHLPKINIWLSLEADASSVFADGCSAP
jgi:ubiquitin-protein ligase E3 D